MTFGIPDTVLSLFDDTGAGVYLNDDITGANTLSCLPSADALNPCPTSRGGLGPLTAGIYFLAISRSANYPIDASSNEIFSPVSSTDVVGPSVTTPVAGWDGGAFTSPDFDLINYDIVLSGTAASSVPEPGTMALAAGAMLLLAVGRAILPAAAFQPARRQEEAPGSLTEPSPSLSRSCSPVRP